jgi:DNA-binding FadR family transcriptional regulator
MRLQLDPGEVHRSLAAVLEILELRRGIEAEAAALAAERCSRAQVAELRRALDAIAREEAAGRDGVLADMDLHRAIARASGNRHFPALWDFVGQFLRAAIRATRKNEAARADFAAQVRAEHLALVDAIARGAPAEAREAALRHMERAAARIREAGPEFWASIPPERVRVQKTAPGRRTGAGAEPAPPRPRRGGRVRRRGRRT